jgi:hypothetical protein
MEFGPIVETLSTTIGGCRTHCREHDIEAKLAVDRAALPSRYDLLGTALSKFHPKAVLLTEYPNPIQDQKGRFCKDETFAFHPIFLPRIFEGLPFADLGLKGSSTEYAYGQLFGTLPDIMKNAASRNGWTLVTGVHAASRKSGYCSTRRWYQPYSTSRDGQGDVASQRIGEGEPNAFIHKAEKPGELDEQRDILKSSVSTGAMHPNMFGYSIMGDAVYNAMAQPRN